MLRIATAVVALVAAPAFAQSPDTTSTQPPTAPGLLTPFAEFAVGFGGDAIAELVYSDGETREMYAGQGGFLAIGARLRPVAALPVSALASVGYKVVFEPSENANVRLSRFPVTLGLRGEGGPGIWAEASVVRHLGTTLHGDDFFPDESFESSTGAVFAAGWKWVGLHYTTIRYTSENDGSEYDASMIGVSGRITLGDGW